MISREICQQVLSKALSTGADYAEVYAENTLNHSIDMIANRVDSINDAVIAGAAVRVYKGLRSVMATTVDTTLSGLLRCAEKAAEAILLKGKAEAEAIELKARAMQQYGQAAMLEMVIEKLPDVARAIGEPLSQTEKIIMFGEGAATGLTRDVTGSMMQTFEAMKASVGLDIPKMLSTISTGGLVGRSVEEATAEKPADAE
jgi:uncharacterized membrane protein YqiK